MNFIERAWRVTRAYYPDAEREALTSISRKREVVHPRHFFWAVLRAMPGVSYDCIAAIGGWHHTTIIHGVSAAHARWGAALFSELALYDGARLPVREVAA